MTTTMTPKNIGAKIVYLIAGCVAVPGLILFVPGGLFILVAFLLGCGADKLEREEFDAEGDTTIEEYEDAVGECKRMGESMKMMETLSYKLEEDNPDGKD